MIQDGQPQDPEAVRMREGGGSCWKERRGEGGWVDGQKGSWEGYEMDRGMCEGDREERS